MTKNVYVIAKDGRTDAEYFDYVTGLNITFNGDRSVAVSPSSNEVTVDGSIEGLTPVRVEEDAQPEQPTQ